VSFVKGQTLANVAFVALGDADDYFAFRVSARATTHVIVDLSGLVASGVSRSALSCAGEDIGPEGAVGGSPFVGSRAWPRAGGESASGVGITPPPIRLEAGWFNASRSTNVEP
jgi:hypothetical protein